MQHNGSRDTPTQEGAIHLIDLQTGDILETHTSEPDPETEEPGKESINVSVVNVMVKWLGRGFGG